MRDQPDQTTGADHHAAHMAMHDREQGHGTFTRPGDQIVQDLAHRQNLEVDGELGAIADEGSDCPRHQHATDAGRGSEPENTLPALRDPGSTADCTLELLEGTVHLGQDPPRLGGRCQASAAPVKELRLKYVLDAADGLCDCRLRNLEPAGSTDHCLRYHDRAEDLDLTECQHFASCRHDETGSSPLFVDMV